MSKLAQVGDLLVPAHMTEAMPIPRAFLGRLQREFASDMCISWNPRRERYVIEQCIEHYGCTADDGIVEHPHTCRRIYVWLVRDEENGDAYMPLGDRVIAKLHESETYRRYGAGPDAFKRFQAESRAFDAEQKQKQRTLAHDTMEYLKKYNRVARNKLKTLLGRHDWLRPNK